MFDRNNNYKLLTGILLTGLMLFASSSSAERLYRWTDEKGVIHYSDKVPPQISKKERHIIDDAGRTREVLDAQKSEEELAAEERRKEEEARAREIAEKKAFEDRLLLDTYSSLDSLIQARDNRIETMKSTIRLKRESIEVKRDELTQHRKTAANAERRGIAISETVLQQIENAEKDIVSQAQSIARIQDEIKSTRALFERDIERYKSLKPQL